MGHQALIVSGLVLFVFLVAAHFGSRSAGWRGRDRLELFLARCAVVIAALIVVWEAYLAAAAGIGVRYVLAVCWSLVAVLLWRRARGLAWDMRQDAARKKGRSGGPYAGRY